MSELIFSLDEKTLSGRSFEISKESDDQEIGEFIRHLGDVYATPLVEMFIDAAITQGAQLETLDDVFRAILEEVRTIEVGGNVPYTDGLMRLSFSVWGLVKLDELVNQLDREGLTPSTLWLFEKVVDGFTEALGEWVRVIDRKSVASAGGKKKYEKHAEAKRFVQKEWTSHRDSYGDNKSAFARDYSRRVKHEMGLDVTEKTIREIWLSRTPATSKQAG